MFKILFILFALFSSLFSSEDSNFLLAQKYEKNNEIKKALELYFKAAKNKDAKALLYLGKLYFEGKYLKRSTKNSIQYLEKSSILGNQKAKYNLGIVYASKKSKEYYHPKKAYGIFYDLALKGYAPAQNKVGVFLSQGLAGMKKDYTKAVKWFENSAKQCYEPAECNLAYMYATGKGVWKNFGRANIFAKKGYKNNNKICKNIWHKYKLYKYPEDKGFKFNFFVKPCE